MDDHRESSSLTSFEEDSTVVEANASPNPTETVTVTVHSPTSPSPPSTSASIDEEENTSAGRDDQGVEHMNSSVVDTIGGSTGGNETADAEVSNANETEADSQLNQPTEGSSFDFMESSDNAKTSAESVEAGTQEDQHQESRYEEENVQQEEEEEEEESGEEDANQPNQPQSNEEADSYSQEDEEDVQEQSENSTDSSRSESNAEQPSASIQPQQSDEPAGTNNTSAQPAMNVRQTDAHLQQPQVPPPQHQQHSMHQPQPHSQSQSQSHLPSHPLPQSARSVPTPLPYIPSITAPTGTSNVGGSDSSFWDLFSSSAPQAKLSRDLVDWAPDLTDRPTLTPLAQDWLKQINALTEQDRVTGHVAPFALRFGFVDELGEFHPMLDWGESSNKKRENKHTARAREAAKDILSSIQHHRVGTRGPRAPSIGQQVIVVPNGRIHASPITTVQPPPTTTTLDMQSNLPTTSSSINPHALTVTVPQTPTAASGSGSGAGTSSSLPPPHPSLHFSPPPSLPNSQNAATHPVFPRSDLPDTNWWLLTTGDGI